MGKYVKTFEQYSGAEEKLFYRADHFERDSFEQTVYGTQPGVYFTTDKEYAESYGWFISVVKLSFNNPLVVDHVNNITDWNFDSEELKADGYDGLLFADPNTGHMIAYTFYPEQVEVVNQYTLPE